MNLLRPGIDRFEPHSATVDARAEAVRDMLDGAKAVFLVKSLGVLRRADRQRQAGELFLRQIDAEFR